ncbi:hypothetical protein SEA_BECKERTON_20 [Mycobacterium phage Beckerton]|uniref:Tail terminator n=1 Tax=Mycobacterium phage Konstantine TaxID=563121 RepID=B5U4Z5_9CAUD|nr:gp25 [Mycobacterium phage Konstantine]ACI12441.1 hypothetical protein KONSTANTINE_25 [Mycobacterium phage Konstantine]QLF83905.1 hypothetical protein SEA_BECKERTON_20 [Mycobacterium phage Beckerton]
MTASVLMERLKADSTLSTTLEVAGHVYDLMDLSINSKGRPRHDGPFVVFNWQESTIFSQTYTGMRNGIPKAPRTLQIWVHFPWDISTDYDDLNRILNRIDQIFAGLEHQTGTDGQRVTMVRTAGRSSNLLDEGYKTIARHATYGVLYDENAPGIG